MKAIKIESCHECPKNPCDISWAANKYEPVDMPKHCPLPDWPEVTQADIDYFCSEMEMLITRPSGKGSQQRNEEEGYIRWLCEKIGTIITEPDKEGPRD